MQRESNRYLNTISGEELSATQFNQFVRSEAKRQYEECSGKCFENMTNDEKEECVLEQFKHQLSDMDWQCVQ